MSGVLPAELSGVLAPEQWAQLALAVARVQAAGYGDVSLRFDGGLPREIEVTIRSEITDAPEQLSLALVDLVGVKCLRIQVKGGAARFIERTVLEQVRVPERVLREAVERRLKRPLSTRNQSAPPNQTEIGKA